MQSHQVQPLNYSAHAIDDLLVTAAELRHGMPKSAQVLQRLIVMLKLSVKFILPNCSELINPDDLRQAHVDLMHLPFPCVAFEAPWIKEDGLDYVGEFKQSPMTRRIALCWDGRQFEPLPGLNRFFDVHEQGGVFVLPIYWGPEHRQWSVALGGAFVPYGGTLDPVDLHPAQPATEIANAARFATGQVHAKSKQLQAEPFPIQPEFFDMVQSRYGSRHKANAQIILDYQDEVMMMIQACSMINCANVTTADVGASAALNKKRQANGKQPFFSYKVLALTGEDKRASLDECGGHHVSPRMHLRRGHLRRLDGKVVWVRPAIVNADSTRGQVHKDYHVGSPLSE